MLETPDASEQPLPDSGDPDGDLASLTARLDQLDRELLALIRHRTAVARQLPAVRTAAGRPRFHHESDLLVARRFADLGRYGSDLARLLLRLAR
jgi:chorismate mutase